MRSKTCSIRPLDENESVCTHEATEALEGRRVTNMMGAVLTQRRARVIHLASRLGRTRLRNHMGMFHWIHLHV